MAIKKKSKQLNDESKPGKSTLLTTGLPRKGRTGNGHSGYGHSGKEARERYARMNLRNGFELQPGEKPPVTGRKREMMRAYELLILKSEEDYKREAAERLAKAEVPADGVPEGTSNTAEEPAGGVPEGASNTAEATAAPEMSEEEAFSPPPLLSKAEWRRKRRHRRNLALAALILVLLLVDARLLFGEPLLLADISGYENVEIEIEGLTAEPFTVTPKELSKLPRTSIKVDVHEGEVAEGEEPEHGRALGPTLDDFLEYYGNGKTTEDFRSMKVYTEKGTSTAYVRTMKEELIVLSVANGNRPLQEKQMPLRIAVDGTDPGEWTGWVRRIVFTE